MSDQFGVPAMHTVEHPDGEHASAPVRGNLVLAAPPLHDRKPTAPGRDMGCQIGQRACAQIASCRLGDALTADSVAVGGPDKAGRGTPNQVWVA